MAKTSTEQRLYDELLAKYGPKVAKAFMAAMDDLRSAADLQRMITALQQRNAEAALAALNLDAAALGPLRDAIQETYTAGGTTSAKLMPELMDVDGARVVVRFDARNPRAEEWLRERSSRLVTRILEDQRTAVRAALAERMAQGSNPRTTALDIVGRTDRATGKRVGGLIGLTVPQERYVSAARSELASQDPAALKNYLSRKRRDKRFDAAVRRALKAGKPVPADTAASAVVAYERRLLKHRGDTLARSESLTALRSAKHEAYLQAVENGSVEEGSIRRTWRSAGDRAVRHTHEALDGETVALREPFASPSGAMLMFPGDTSLGAGPEEIVNCRCDVDYRIDFLANLS